MRRTAVLLLTCVPLFAGCGEEEGGPAGDGWTHQVHPPGTNYYVQSPQQPKGPDGRLPGGTLVKILSRHGDYLKVESENGHTAFVRTTELQPRD